MTTRLLTIWLCVALAGTLAGADLPSLEVRLLGIASHEKVNLAIIEVRHPRTSESLILAAGDVMGPVTVLAIDPTNGTVKVRVTGATEPVELELPHIPEAIGKHTLNLHAVPVDTLLDLYQRLTSRTVLRAPGLPSATLTIVSRPGVGLTEALADVISALGTNGVLVKSAGEFFAFAVPNSRESSLSAIPPPPEGASPPIRQAISGNMMRFHQADSRQVLELYEELANRTVLRPNNLSGSPMTFKNETMLTRAQGVWMLEAMFQLQGLAVISGGNNLAIVAPFARTNGLPRFAAFPLLQDTEPVGNQTLHLSSASAEQFLKLYCSLAKKEFESVAPAVRNMRIDFRSRNSLARREAIFALETLAALNDLAFIENEERKVELGPVPEPRNQAAEPNAPK